MDSSTLGFRYYPFDQWDASQDAHLEDYFLVPAASSIAWKDIPTIIFAPRGGGKTALRVYTERVCTQSMGLTFSITHIPNEIEVSTPESKLTNLSTSIARDVLRYLIMNPNRFYEMSAEDQKKIILTIRTYLTIPLGFLLELPYTNIAQVLRFPVGDIKYQPNILESIKNINNGLDDSKLKITPVNELFYLIQQLMSVKNIYVLLDGVDGFYETGYQTSQIQKWLTPLLKQAQVWSSSSVYIKAFLPLPQEFAFNNVYHNQSWITASTMIWNEVDLARLIRQRVTAASDGKFESLDDKCDLKLRDLETTIVHLLPEDKKLPREALVLTHLIIEQAILRSGESSVTIKHNDVDLAYRKYLDKLPQINSSRVKLV